MRRLIDETITKIADEDESVRLVVADLGNFKKFRSKYPNRFINVGVAESNAVGIAAGLSSEGNRVFIFGVSGFILYRAFEQIKFSIGYWNQPICILGTGFGWRYHFIGRGHFIPDDIALMRLIPNLDIYTPTTGENLIRTLTEVSSNPKYVRIFDECLSFEININSAPETGSEGIILSFGEMAKRCFLSVRALRDKGHDLGFIGFNDLKESTIKDKLVNCNLKKIIIIEDHIEQGGLCNIVTKLGYKIYAHKNLPLRTEAIAKTEEELFKYYGFDNQSIIDFISSCL